MRHKTIGSNAGKHRKVSAAQTTKGRIAFVALATGAISGAGVGGAAAATANSQPEQAEATPSPDVELSSQSEPIADAPTQAAPQVLAIPEFKPVSGLAEQLDKAVQASSERAAADKAMRGSSVVNPAEGAFTSGFGMRWGSMHNGIDIANAMGTPILAAMDGTVIDAGPASGYGNWVRIKHDDGSITVYGHMETIDVTVGQHVTAGQKIAGMGSRGFSTGSHLHFEIHPGGGAPVDPIAWFASNGVTIS
ncbi:M23 family metallopeptidase [Corynebacterium tapiri]|uniref:M23 family metallopeptidase n=1 Tax=Corynebacterium tapiri TaxID=1448266 RepID=A0A5C4U6N5_9CORY|nr:M23 family metallopeptidase [Corynebacterium tapiri]TNM00414.1 M23 family metallopeptidase [Corynebacterium tapiri]